ncbi:MAG: fimbrial biogenesis outer membrane usher protein [Polaromonas sp.]|nr:fimbrial biogenesis outer membrane usher protein [Polaromonas sp.]
MAAAGPLIAAEPAAAPSPTSPPPAASALKLSRALGSSTPAAVPPPIQSIPTPTRLLPLEITVNGVQAGNWVLLERDGALYAPADAFDEWRVNRRPAAEPLVHQGQPWYPLSAVPGFDAQFNFANQSLDLNFQPQAFAATRLAQPVSERPTLTSPSLGAFANYDISYTRSALRGVGSIQELGALVELGVSNGWGVLTSSHVAHNLTSHDPLTPRNVRRLETAFTRDRPDDNLTLRLGDSSTRSGAWGRSVYFGGVQLSRNFSLSPGFIAQPLPVVTGLSSAPSTVELYINDALRQTSQVPTGPFAIDNLPLLTGSGQARLVVRDVLGRETVLVQDFFSHSELLEQGLSDWSAEAGAVRKNLGLSNADYGQRFTSGLWRYGFDKTLTLEARGELGRDTRGAGLGLVRALPFNMLGQIAAAFSRDDSAGRGSQWLMGLEHSSLRHGFTLRSQGASPGYRQIGQDANSPAFQRQLSGSYTYSSEHFGAVGLGYARVNNYGQSAFSTYSANYSIRLGERSSLSLTVVRVSGLAGGNGGGTSVGVNLLVPLERQLAISSSLSRRGGQTDGYVSANQGLSGDTGLGWRVLAGERSGQNYAEGGLYYGGTQGMVTADLNASASQQTVRLGAQGGLVAIDSQLFASRQIQGSFALVEVPGYADVGVGFQGSVLARTNQDGKALVPHLLPYQANSIRLDPSELPISAELDSIEQVVVPGNRSGVIVRFPVRSGRGALIKIVLDDGEPAPAGAEIELMGDKQEFFVARRGEAFVTGLQAKNSLRLKWNGAACQFEVTLPPGNLDNIARVGPVACQGVTR